MPDDLPALPRHAPMLFRGVRLDAYSLDLPENGGQVGDRASHRAFDAILAGWRTRLRAVRGQDPFGPDPAEPPPRDALDEALA
ncbi:hypothetical protein, partial [Falsiroseomonas oryzae]|uniref:hypothetical protein n=1 Tax=Falsiroseomonas oryzae TaxID=2766473 RepID=UPI0022EB0A2C